MLSIMNRYDWELTKGILGKISDLETLSNLASILLENPKQSQMILSAILVTDQPSKIANYYQSFPKTASKDLEFATRLGKDSLDERVERFISLYNELGSKANQVSYIDLRYDTGAAVGWFPEQELEESTDD